VVEESGEGGDAWHYSVAHGYSNLILAVLLMPGFRLQRPSDVDTCRELSQLGNDRCKRLVGDTKYCEASRLVCLGNFWGRWVIVSVGGQKLLALDCCRVGLSALTCTTAGSLNDTRRVGTVDAEVDQGRGFI
jgi:hypothetical protein